MQVFKTVTILCLATLGAGVASAADVQLIRARPAPTAKGAYQPAAAKSAPTGSHAPAAAESGKGAEKLSTTPRASQPAAPASAAKPAKPPAPAVAPKAPAAPKAPTAPVAKPSKPAAPAVAAKPAKPAPPAAEPKKKKAAKAASPGPALTEKLTNWFSDAKKKLADRKDTHNEWVTKMRAENAKARLEAEARHAAPQAKPATAKAAAQDHASHFHPVASPKAYASGAVAAPHAHAHAPAVKVAEPVAHVAAAPKTKPQKLADLLDQYKADKITPVQYQEQRAKILTEP